MRKLLVTVAAAVGLLIGTAAHAAPVDISLTNGGGGSWNLSINNTSGTGIGSLALLTDPAFTAVTFNAANTGISVPDSVLTIDPLGTGQNFLVVNNVAGQTIAPSGATTLIATLTATGTPNGNSAASLLFLTYNIDIPSVNDVAGTPIAEANVHLVPEPGTVLLLGLGLASMALVRRRAA